VPRSGLLPEDGATFHARIDTVAEGVRKLFQATYRVQLDLKSRVEVETPDIETFDTGEQARAWIHQTASARGFKTIFWEDQEQ
jgi:hypothetical protein